MKHEHLKTEIVQLAVIIKGKKALCLTLAGYLDPMYHGMVTLPGGRINKGEEPVEGLKRELLEETGLKINKLKLVHTDTEFFPHDGEDRYVVIYGCDDFKGEVKLSNEHIGYEWLGLEELGEQNWVNEKISTWIKKAFEALESKGR